MLKTLDDQLSELADRDQAAIYQRFFKTGPGQYGQGDLFLGITVPELRRVARNYFQMNDRDLGYLLDAPEHEKRLIALIILRHQYERGDDQRQDDRANFYLTHRQGVNNWDLVDASAPYLTGGQLAKGLLWEEINNLSLSDRLWDRRIAIVSTLGTIRAGNNQPTLLIAEQLLDDREDLIHKASGWMLREAGKRNLDDLYLFLDDHAKEMPRTMLRYSLERVTPDKRDYYMSL